MLYAVRNHLTGFGVLAENRNREVPFLQRLLGNTAIASLRTMSIDH